MDDIQKVIENCKRQLNEKLETSDMYLRQVKLSDQLIQYKTDFRNVVDKLNRAENDNDYIKVVELEQKKETTKKAIQIVEERLSKIDLSLALDHKDVKIIINDFTKAIGTIISEQEVSYRKVANELLNLNRQSKEYNNDIYMFENYLRDKHHYLNALNLRAKCSASLESELQKIVNDI